MFCIVVINKQKYCFEKKNCIASKSKRECFLSSTISVERIQELKICLQHARNQQKIMLILVIKQCYLGEVSLDLFPKGCIFGETSL